MAVPQLYAVQGLPHFCCSLLRRQLGREMRLLELRMEWETLLNSSCEYKLGVYHACVI